MSTERYQNLVIGTGEAGKYLAWTLARQGQKTIIVERSLMGGACPNVACLPSKNVIYSAKVVSLARDAADFGLENVQSPVNMSRVIDRKREMIDGLMQLHTKLFQESGTELLMGEARFVAPKTVNVALKQGGTRTIVGERVFLGVGTRASIPDTPGLADAKPMTHVEALNLEQLPEHLVVIGGGYVGVEFAQAMRRFGSRVTIIQRGGQLLERTDPDIANAVRQLLQDEGIEVLLKTNITSVSGASGAKVGLETRSGDTSRRIEATHLLVAAGRTPNTDRLDLDQTGVQLDSRRYIQVNERLETTAPDIWAMGDLAGSPQFTHVSFDDFRVVRDNLAGGNRTTTGRLIPSCLFTDPELAQIGLTETEAKASGIKYRLAQLPMANILRTRTISETRGFVKALIGDDDRILGFAAFGAESSELLSAVQTAMIGGMRYTQLRDGIFAHPTIAEGLTSLFAKV